MSIGHKIYIVTLVVIVVVVFVFLCLIGFSYYNVPLEERFFHESHNLLKPGGTLGHGLGIFGSLSMIFGMLLYMVRKRMRSLSRLGVLKHWLEFHIFLCTLGPVLVLFHTSFKFGGLVAVSFWSMVAVFLSGIIGRFIYIQIPRTIEGRELSLNEVRDMKTNIGLMLSESFKLDETSHNLIVESTKRKVELYQANFIAQYIKKFITDRKTIRSVRVVLKKNKLPHSDLRKVLKLVKHEISLNRRIEQLVTMQKLFKYWHVAHLPFALVMVIIMIIHVAVTIVLGYRWIF
ncbi:MAG: hypothetical protein M0Q38_03215 [Bacteroidales bacterium]|jgi:hypothetical protein|nr:hypothetical protein [Bacteroidales bacterium]